MKKRRVANAVMGLLIVVVLTAGILGVGHIRGWFDKETEETVLLTEEYGIITLERDGVAYTVTDDTVLRDDDRILCEAGATVLIQIGDSYIVLGQSAEVEIVKANISEFALHMLKGEAFINAVSSIHLQYEDQKIEVKDAVAGFSVRKGAQTLSVYSGTVGEAGSGQIIEWVGDAYSIEECAIESLNTFIITQMRKVNESRVLCFTNKDLDLLEQQRLEQQMEAAADIAEDSEKTEKADTSQEDAAETENAGEDQENESQKPEESDKQEENTKSEESVKQDESAKGGDSSDKEESSGKENSEKQESSSITEESSKNEDNSKVNEAVKNEESSKTESEDSTVPPVQETKLTCTISIVCDTILNNWDNLDPAKAAYVPSNGCILPAVTVTFTQGETVFDVLNRVCTSYGIQLEYSWTPMYDSYYVEGINNLYEFDCGSESGWMYKVNGWFPNYGCSGYVLTGGESIVWCYTCVGYGADVGGR